MVGGLAGARFGGRNVARLEGTRCRVGVGVADRRVPREQRAPQRLRAGRRVERREAAGARPLALSPGWPSRLKGAPAGTMGVVIAVTWTITGVLTVVLKLLHLVRPDVAGIAMGFSILVGVVFGLYPAIKASRKWGYKVKGVPENMAEIIVCDGNFSGRTTTIISFSDEPQYQDGFGPFTPGFKNVPFGDANAFEAAITPNTTPVASAAAIGAAAGASASRSTPCR